MKVNVSKAVHLSNVRGGWEMLKCPAAEGGAPIAGKLSLLITGAAGRRPVRRKVINHPSPFSETD